MSNATHTGKGFKRLIDESADTAMFYRGRSQATWGLVSTFHRLVSPSTHDRWLMTLRIPKGGRSLVAAFAALVATTACLPYTVGSTAQTVPYGERLLTSSYYIIPNGVTLRDSLGKTLFGFDTEYRSGIADDADVGVRIVSGSGIVVNYKRMVAGYNHPDSAAFSGLAVYHDHSALGLRSNNIILVPSISVRGDMLQRILHPF